MVKSSKQLLGSKMAMETGKILPSAIFVLGLFNPALQAQTQDIPLETTIWTSDLDDAATLEKRAVRALQLNPNGAYEHYLVAELSLRLFKHNPQELRFLKQASDLSQQAIELAPTQEYGYLVAAQVLDLMGYKDDAFEMLAPRPSFTQGWRTSLVRGVISASHDNGKNSFADFDKSLKAPGVPKDLVGTYVAMSLESHYSGTELIQKLEIWNKKTHAPAMKMSLAKALEESGDFKRAHSVLYELNKKDGTEESRLSEASLLYTGLGRTKDAEKMLIPLSHSKEIDISASAKAHLARIQLKKGDAKTAFTLFADAVENHSEKLKWIAFSHNAYRDVRKLDDFSNLLSEYAVRLPGSSYIHALQGEVLSEGLAEHEKAIDSYEAAITLDPKRSEFYTGMGLAYYRMQKHEKALAIFNKAIKIDPKDATARYNEACVLAIMGRGEEAVGSLQKAISLDGRLQAVAKTDKDFEGIRSNAQFQSLVKTEFKESFTKAP